MPNPFVSGCIRPVPLVVLAALLASCGQEGQTGAPAAPPMPRAGVLSMQPQDVVIELALNGRVEAVSVSEVRPQVEGIIRERLFKEGVRVKAGDLLYRIDQSVYQARHEKAKASLALAQAALEGADAKAVRARVLSQREVISAQETEVAETALAEARAQVAAAGADVESARIDLARTEVRAPIDGIVGKSSVTEGALVSVSQSSPLVVIRATDEVNVALAMPSAELAKLKKGLAGHEQKVKPEVRLQLEDGTSYPHVGQVEFSEAVVDTATGTYTVQAKFANPDGVLLPGLFVRASVEQAVANGVYRLPQRAVSRNAKGEPTALIVGKDGLVEQRVIDVLTSSGGDWVVSANAADCGVSLVAGSTPVKCTGIGFGEQVVIEGGMNAKAGSKVDAYPVVVDAATGLAVSREGVLPIITQAVK